MYLLEQEVCLFGIPTFKDIFTTPQLKGATLSLVDIDEENLERMYSLALTMNEAYPAWN